MHQKHIRAKEEQREQKNVILPALGNEDPVCCIKIVVRGGRLGITECQNVVVGIALT